MIRLRGVDEKDVIEMPEDAVCQLVDGLHYVETKEVKRIGAKTKLREHRAFEMVQIDTGFDDDVQPRVMTILPKRPAGVAMLLAALALLLCAAGCGSGMTYHYTYTCSGAGCAPQSMPARFIYGVQPAVIQTQPQARVVYVDRPVELRVNDNGAITRRAATPQLRDK